MFQDQHPIAEIKNPLWSLVLLETDIHISKLIRPNIHSCSSSSGIFTEKMFIDSVILKFKVSCRFVFV